MEGVEGSRVGNISIKAAKPKVALETRLLRMSYRLGAVIAPKLAGRLAADAFGRSRQRASAPRYSVPLGAERFQVRGSSGIKQGYLWRQDGPSALLVHGWASDSSSMSSFVAPLRSLGFQVAAFDAPAHGAAPGNMTTMTQFTQAVKDVLHTIGGAQVIIAHSLGSIAAIAAIADTKYDIAPQRVVLVAPAGSLADVLERWSRSHLCLPKSIIERIYAELHIRNGVPVSHWDIAGLGGKLKAPVLVAHDPDDPVVPFGHAERIAAVLPSVRLEVVPNVGHARILSSPQVASFVKEFIAGDFLSFVNEGF